MGLQMDFGGIGDANNVQDGGGRPKPGHGMGIITEFKEYTGPSSSHELEIEIVAWTSEESVAMTHKQLLFTQDKSGKGHPQKVMCALGIASGLFTAADITEWNKRKVQPDVDYTSIVGRPVMFSLVEEPDMNDKTKLYIKVGQIGKAYYHIGDDRVKDWPRNAAVVANKGVLVGDYTPDKLKASAGGGTSAAGEVESTPFD